MPGRGRSLVQGVLLAASAVVCLGPTAAAQSNASSFAQLAKASLAQIDGTLRAPGLKDEVEVLRDRWGVPHIYAKNMDDLFFAQGYVQAQDRLWQMEMWRRIGDGTLAEVMGPSAVERDRQARLLMYRGAFDDAEYGSYHPEGKRILEAFVRGVNAYITQNANNLPVEFKLTGIKPQLWTSRTPLLRRTTFGAAAAELRLARQVAEIGIDEWNRRNHPTPYRVLTVPNGLKLDVITPAVIAAAGGEPDRLAQRGGLPRPAMLPQYQSWPSSQTSENEGAFEDSPGSNNWVINGSKSASGKVLLAGDPHRQVTNPSLRYLVHLNAPGWSVTGATEPMLPGVLFGHNDHIGWALTIVGTDQGDVFVNEVNPANPNQVKWKGAWENLRVVRDTIRVKDAAPRIVELKFSRHGPVFYEDTVNHLNYAYRAVDNEPGSAGYLSGLMLDQVGNCRDFLTEVLKRFKAPTENMVCGDDGGNISWMAAALSPKRAGGWDGRLPVPGTGAYEWAGFRDDLPREYNPARGFINTANHDIHPPGFDPPLFFKTGDFPRYERIYQLLSAGTNFTVEDFERMQHDTYWAAAAPRQELLKGWTGATLELETARALVAGWDRFYDKPSVAASVYDVWARRLVANRVTPNMAKPTRDSLAQRSLREALDSLSTTYHTSWMRVNWGKINRSEFPHQFVTAYDIPTVERRGGAGTVAAFGATIRQITDFSNYDNSVQMNTPGQSGQPGSPYYDNLARSSADAQYFPQMWTRPAVETVVAHRLKLVPGGK
jgi:Protein related to penicillin acylase